MENELSVEILHYLFKYHRTGNLVRLRNAGIAKRGDFAGRTAAKGYYHVCIGGKKYLLHRLIFLMHHGYLPEFVDHADGNPSNNRIKNLRPASRELNGANRKKLSNNTTGFKGVYWLKSRNRWVAEIRVDKKMIRIGTFPNKTTAARAYDAAAIKYYGDYASLNFPLKKSKRSTDKTSSITYERSP